MDEHLDEDAVAVQTANPDVFDDSSDLDLSNSNAASTNAEVVQTDLSQAVDTHAQNVVSWPTEVAKTPTSAPAAARKSLQRERAVLTVGGLAKVVAGDQRFMGFVGPVATLAPDSVELETGGAFGTHRLHLRRDHVDAVDTNVQRQPVHMPPSQTTRQLPRDTAETSPQLFQRRVEFTLRQPRWWTGLTPYSRLGVITVSAIVLIAIVVAIANANSRDEASYRFGHDHVSLTAAAFANAGTSGNAEYLCKQAYVVAAGFGADKGLVKDDVLAGCVDGIGDKRS